MKRKRLKWVPLLLCVLWTITGAGTLHADDTDIYGGDYSVEFRPNMLIMFDNSGSMKTVDVGGEEYDSTKVYDGTYEPPESVWYKNEWDEETDNCLEETFRCIRWSGKGWKKKCEEWGTQCKRYEKIHHVEYVKVADSVDGLCSVTGLDALVSDGQARLKLNSDGTCSNSSRNFYMANFLNYDSDSSLEEKSRIEVAKEVVKGIIADTSNVNFGLMIFNSNQGGRVAIGLPNHLSSSYIGDDAHKQLLYDTIDALTPETMTPLAETLAEAGLYYAGKEKKFGGSGTYDSPILAKCQKNYVIIMTDGDPTSDQDPILYTKDAYMGETIGDLDTDGNEASRTYGNDGSDYLDDVAYFLNQHDLSPLGSSGDFEYQNLVIYTIGFTIDNDLLSETAINGGAVGGYMTANSISALDLAFRNILSQVKETSAVFVAPVVPVSRMNRTYSGDRLYIGFFKPSDTGRWQGNLKKYKIDETTGIIYDANDIQATLAATGQIVDSARSIWSTEVDGADVGKGGAGSLLLSNSSRNIYTNIAASPTDLTLDTNAFATGNTNLTDTMLAVSGETERTAVINDIHGVDSLWKLGDILHSEPIVVQFDTDDNGFDVNDPSYIFVGSNDGMMHCFNDSTGQEVWAFIPDDLRPNLKLLSDTTPVHEYFVDGVPRMMSIGSDRYLFFGERRGGFYYHLLKVTDPTAPVHQYKIGQDILGLASDGVEQLGQSWGKPVVGTIKTSATDSEKVIFLPGGYDQNQDHPSFDGDVSPDANDSMGRAVFAVNASTGNKMDNFKFYYDSTTNPDMTHSFVNLSAADVDGDGYIDRVYAADMAGNLFAFEDMDKEGTWNQRLLFKASETGVQRKVFGAPDLTTVAKPQGVTGGTNVGEMVFYGTGDREHPQDTSVTNGFYAIKNYWDDASQNLTKDTQVDPNDAADDDVVICNATDDPIQMGTAGEKTAYKNCLSRPENRGWYMEFKHTGEKLVGTPVLFNGVVYFTTYTPEDTTATATPTPTPTVDPDNYDDMCDAPSSGGGTGRLYAVDAFTGAAVMNFQSTTEKDGEGNTVGEDDNLSEGDRSKVVSGSMPSDVIVTVFKGGAKVILGAENKIITEDISVGTTLHKAYWRQME